MSVQQLENLLQQGAVCLVEILRTQGSAPRGVGAWMAVQGDTLVGTIGGGHLEWEAMRIAREHLAQGQRDSMVQRISLGPSLGQCCGGAVELRWSTLTQADAGQLARRLVTAHTPVALFGAGHVGHALVRVLQPLPFAVQWIDSREAMFPAQPMPQVQYEHSQPVHDAVQHLPAQSLVLVMSFSHAEDLDIVCACLRRQRMYGDLPFVGLIGSATKWAVFQKRLAERGFTQAEIEHITCPIGVVGVPGKEPEVIAIAVAAQLLQLRAAQLAPR